MNNAPHTGQQPLALHTWTLESTPLADVLRIAHATGWDAVELRRRDLERALAAVAVIEREAPESAVTRFLRGDVGIVLSAHKAVSS